jgi:LacI family transcriptional regulator
MAKKNDSYSGVKEIARLAGVSIGTVDRVIHKRTGVSDATKEKVNKIIEELNYQPNILASRLASRKKFLVAVLIPEASTETDFWNAPLLGINRAADEFKNYGVQLKFFFFNLSDEKSFTRQSKSLFRSKADGILLAPVFPGSASVFLDNCREKKLPVILIDSTIKGATPLSYIGPDMYYSGYQVAQLMAFGNQNLKKVLLIEMVTGDDDSETGRGFRNYFLDNGQNPEILKLAINSGGFTAVGRSLSTLFKKHDDIEAIFVSNSRVALVAKFLQREKRGGIMLIGYDILKENLAFLENKTIDFLICHEPEKQGYSGLMSMVQKLVFNKTPELVQHMPIDIITKENYRFYKN